MRLRRSSGSVLVLVLWTLVLFTVYAVSLGASARARATLLSRTQLMASLESIAYCGIERAKAVVANDTTDGLDTSTDTWADSAGAFYDVPAGEGLFRVGVFVPGRKTAVFHAGIVDEESKINLNKADAGVIAHLLQVAAQMDLDEAQELSQNILDWRDQDSNHQHPQYGAEDKYYDDLVPPYLCKDAPLEVLDELLLIKGIKREIFDKITPFVTLFGSGAVNVNTAPKEVLLALGLPVRTVDKMMVYRAGADGEIGTRDDAAFAQVQVIAQLLELAKLPLDGEERAAVSNLADVEKLTVVSNFFSAHSQGVSPGGAVLGLDAVFDREGKVYSVRSSGVKWPSRV